MEPNQTTNDNHSPRKTQAIEIIELLLDSDVELFHDQYNEPYISIDGTTELTFGLNSKAFKQWLAHFIYVQLGKAIGSYVQNSVIQILSGKAMYESGSKSLELRALFQKNDKLLWYDLGQNTAALIGENNWTTIEDAKVIFRRLSHQKPNALPDLEAAKSDIFLLLELLNIKKEQDELLFIVYLITAFLPGFPHPLLILHGPQGAGKTTPFMMLKQLVDPSQINTLSAPTKPEDFIQIASGHYFFYFDNLSVLPQWLSDSLARLVTGDGFAKRRLFTDDDDFVKTFRRTVGLNGIHQVITQPDLLDRAILIGLERISDERRMEYKAFWDRFEDLKPRLLGAAFQTIADAIAIYPSVQLKRLPRMADFLHWGCAITKALGRPQSDFIDAYYANINRQNDEAIESSLVAQAIIDFMSDKDEWQGKPAVLFELLVNDNSLLKPRNPSTPKAPNWLVRELTKLQPTLLSQGILYERFENLRPRQIRFQKRNNTVGTDVRSDDKTPGDSTSAPSVN